MNDEPGELSPEARALVAIGRAGDEPTASDRARVRAKLMVGIAGGAVILGAGKAAAVAHSAGSGATTAAGSAAAAGTAAGASGALSAKVAAGVLAVALVTVGGTVAVMRPGTDAQAGSSAAPRPSAPHRQLTVEETAVPPAPEAAAPRGGSGRPASAPSAERQVAAAPAVAAPEAIAPAAAAAVPASERASALPAQSREQAPALAAPKPAPRARASSARVMQARSGLPELTSTPPKPKLARTNGEAKSAEPQAPAAEPSPSLRRELTLIAAAQAALARNAPDEALRWLDAHAAGYASGELVQERLAARAVALCALGKDSEGKRAVAELARMAPSSPLLGRARRACAVHEP